jgi:hypothetical protein
MNPVNDQHLDEDLLADWVLEGDVQPDSQDLAHLEDCTLCRKRVEALRHLQIALKDLDLRRSTGMSSAIPARLTRRAFAQRESRQTRAWAAIGVATAAMVAMLVPRISPQDRTEWTDPAVEQAVTTRTMEILGALPESVADSLLALPSVSDGRDRLVAMPVAAPFTRLGDDERRALLQILQERTSRARDVHRIIERGGT